MTGRSDWHESIAVQIDQLKNTISESDYKKYKLNLLLCVTQRVAEFAPECGRCQILQQDISTLTQDVGNLVQVADKYRRKAHLTAINGMINHLRKQHKLITEGYYMGIGMVFGTAIGVAIGAAMPNVASGIPIGIGVGMAMGVALDAKAKKEGRIICPSQKTISYPQKTRIMVIIGLGNCFLG
jgi:hypothetical protein